MAAPSMTAAGSYNVASAVTVAAGATRTDTIYGNAGATLNKDLALVYAVKLQFKWLTGGAVAGTNGFKVVIMELHQSKSSPVADTVRAADQYQQGSLSTSTSYLGSSELGTAIGYQVQVTNLDATNACTYSLGADVVDSIA